MSLSGCFLSGRFNMFATVLTQRVDDSLPTSGTYDYVQDPVSGAIVRVWTELDPDDGTSTSYVIPCTVSGVIDGGIRVAGTTERFSEIYENIDWARMMFPSGYTVTKRDKITDIKDSDGNILWKEEEIDGRATIFEVRGVTPVIEGFTGRVTEYVALLERAEIQVHA